MLSLKALLPLALAATANAAPTVTNATTSSIDAQNATSYSLVYGYPLLSWANFVGPLVKYLGVNKWYHSPYLVMANDPTAKDIVAPNEDTLYSVMVVDLTKESVNITVPDVSSDWFYLFSFYDPFGDNWANIGTKNPMEGPGDFLLQRSPDIESCGAQEDNSTGYKAILNAPQALGVILVRWLIFNDSSYEQVHQWQNETTATQITLPIADQIDGGAQAALLAANSSSSPAEAVMRMIAEINPYCPANNTQEADAEFAAAGIKNGTYVTPPGVDLAAANATVPTISDAAINAPGNLINVGNGWNVIAPNASGTYGSNYPLREAVAGPYYLQITEPNAYYPTFTNGSTEGSSISTDFDLGPNDAYIYTFSGRPPLTSTGFWSLTLYQDQYLVPNPLDRSALGDRANLTFPDGQLIYQYGGEITSAPDGPFQILVQPADIEPPTNWTANWLPGPSGGGSDVSVLLRFYDAYDGVMNGTYAYPVVTKQSAIGNGTAVNGTQSSTSSTGATSPAGYSSATQASTYATGPASSSIFNHGTYATGAPSSYSMGGGAPTASSSTGMMFPGTMKAVTYPPAQSTGAAPSTCSLGPLGTEYAKL